MGEKTTGYIMLFIGIFIMFMSALFMFLAFSNTIKPFELFSIPVKSTTESSATDLQSASSPSELTNLLTSQLTSQISNQLITPESINKTLNLSTYSILMFFLLTVGFKIASLGVMMVRAINVKLKSDMLELDKTTSRPYLETPVQTPQFVQPPAQPQPAPQQ